MTVARAHAHALTSASTVTNTTPLIRRPTTKKDLCSLGHWRSFNSMIFLLLHALVLLEVASRELYSPSAVRKKVALTTRLLLYGKDSCFGNALKLAVPLISGLESRGALRFRPICTDFTLVLDCNNKKTYLRFILIYFYLFLFIFIYFYLFLFFIFLCLMI